MDLKTHWQRVYTTNATDAVSWFESEPTLSARFIEAAGIGPDT